MNLRSLRYFLKVAEFGSITRAALGLHITQPSLTQHLRHLEEHFGLPLFMRHGRGVILTEAGKTALKSLYSIDGLGKADAAGLEDLIERANPPVPPEPEFRPGERAQPTTVDPFAPARAGLLRLGSVNTASAVDEAKA